MAESRRISFVGAGNVATHLANALYAAGCDIVDICARSIDSAQALAISTHARAIDNPSEINPDVDAVIIAATDTSTPLIASQLPPVRGFVAHTSGSVPLEALSAHHGRAAVIYPLQTFSRDVYVDVAQVPFFTEATDEDTHLAADGIAGLLGDNVHHADSAARVWLHIAGVFSCNFTVFMLEQARQALRQVGLPIDTVRPLVDATVTKAFLSGPIAAMTGPARRGDIATLRKQYDVLPSNIQKDIYKVVSDAILNTFHHEQDSISS